jgi:hypothetical protein
MKVLIVFLLVFSLQFPAWAVECPLPEFPVFEQSPYGASCDSSDYPGDSGCWPTRSELIGTWAECKDDYFYIYGLYHIYSLLPEYPDWTAPLIARSTYQDYSQFSAPVVWRNPVLLGSDVYNDAVASFGTIINQSALCWCPPPPCLFPQCIGEQISQKFPFDIFLNIPAAIIDCPSVTFFGKIYDLCWLYELLRWFKYPIAISLLVKLAMHL